MRKELVISLLLFLIINLLAINITNAPIGTTISADPNLIQDETIKPGAQDINSYPSTHASTATVTNPTNAYDKNQTTYALVTPTSTYPTWQYFDVKVFNATTLKSYAFVSIKMNYSVLIYNAYYRITAKVGGASVTLLPFTTLPTNVTTPTLTTWNGVIEPNDGLWSAADLNNLIVKVEVSRKSSTGSMKCDFMEYEVWATIQGDGFTYRVNVADVPIPPNELYGWGINITFNPLVLQCVTVNEGPFLRQAGATYALNVAIDNEIGCVYAGTALKDTELGGATGSGLLATVAFRVSNQGNSILKFDDSTKLRSWNGTDPIPIPYTASDGYFRSIQGDINGDLQVDVLDLYRLGKAYGSTLGPPPSSNWNVNCDLNKDNVINTADLTIVKNNYG